MGLPPCLQALHPGIPDETSATRSIIRSFHVTMISRERLRQLRYHYDVLGNVGLMFDSLLRSNAPNQPRDNFSILPFPTSTKSRDLKKREDKNFQAELTRGTVVATDPRPEPSSRTDYNYVEQLRLRLLGFRKPSAYASCSIFFLCFLSSIISRQKRRPVPFTFSFGRFPFAFYAPAVPRHGRDRVCAFPRDDPR